MLVFWVKAEPSELGSWGWPVPEPSDWQSYDDIPEVALALKGLYGSHEVRNHGLGDRVWVSPKWPAESDLTGVLEQGEQITPCQARRDSLQIPMPWHRKVNFCCPWNELLANGKARETVMSSNSSSRDMVLETQGCYTFTWRNSRSNVCVLTPGAGRPSVWFQAKLLTVGWKRLARAVRQWG